MGALLMRKPSRETSKTYRAWAAMLQRCYNPTDVSFADYGGRGIRVCEEWSIFENFLRDMEEAPENRWLDRRDNNGGYTPDNCRWATPKESGRNTRRCKLTEAQVAELKALATVWKGSQRRLARAFAAEKGLRSETVREVLKKRTWA